MTFSSDVAGNACCTVFAKFSRTTIKRAPLSLSWCSSSRAVYSGLTFTTTMPARSIPKTTTGYWRRFGIMMATRSPGSRSVPDWR